MEGATLRSSLSQPISISTTQLRAQVRGRVITPDDPAYDQARTQSSSASKPSTTRRGPDEPGGERNQPPGGGDPWAGQAVRRGGGGPGPDHGGAPRRGL